MRYTVLFCTYSSVIDQNGHELKRSLFFVLLLYRQTKRPKDPPAALGPMVTRMNFNSPKYENEFRAAEAQQALLVNATADQQLRVNLPLMEVELREVMSKPRSAITHHKTYTDVGSYIYKKMAAVGLLVSMQPYKHELPITEYSNALGENMVSLLKCCMHT